MYWIINYVFFNKLIMVVFLGIKFLQVIFIFGSNNAHGISGKIRATYSGDLNQASISKIK